MYILCAIYQAPIQFFFSFVHNFHENKIFLLNIIALNH